MSQPARRSIASRPAARQVKLAMVPPVTNPTALPSGSPSRSSSHELATCSVAVAAGREPGQPGVLVPGADQPVRGQRGRVRAAHHHPVEAAGRDRGQSGLERRREVLDDRGSALRSVLKRAAEPFDELLHLRLGWHRPAVQRVEPPPGMLDGDGQGGGTVSHARTEPPLADVVETTPGRLPAPARRVSRRLLRNLLNHRCLKRAQQPPQPPVLEEGAPAQPPVVEEGAPRPSRNL